MTDWQENGEVEAERLLWEELARRCWREADLGRHRQGDPGKRRISWRLRAETKRTLPWIARRLRMGVRTHGSKLAFPPHIAKNGLAIPLRQHVKVNWRPRAKSFSS